ncbi:MAG TPA: amidohydrolase family protein [Vicinamibacterales bacterium]
MSVAAKNLWTRASGPATAMLLAAVVLLTAGSPRAQTGTLAITNARILPVSGPVIERGTILVENGRVTAVGAGVSPSGAANVIDAKGRTVTPGFIESVTQIGVVEIELSAQGTNDGSISGAGGLSAAFRVVDAFNANSTVIPVTRVEGVTRAMVVPSGSGGLFAGQGAIVALTGDHVPAAITKAPAAMVAVLGERGASLAGGSRAAAMARLREALQDARDYAEHRDAWQDARRRPYALGRLDLEALQPVLRREIPLAVEAHRASDLLAAMRIAEEFDVRLVLLGAAEGWMVADELARQKVPVVIKPLTNLPDFDRLGATLENAARLAKAGVEIVISTFDTHNARNLRQEVGNAIAYGLDPARALEAVTLAPARVWGVADRLGSIEPGREADLVIWSGDPFELLTTADVVIIAGREMPKTTRQRELFEKYRTLK